MRFAWRALWTLPLMAVAGFCIFGFVDTFEPMPRLRQFSLRGMYGMAGVGALATIVWMWLKPRSLARPE
jgi:hypothetical protein